MSEEEEPFDEDLDPPVVEEEDEDEDDPDDENAAPPYGVADYWERRYDACPAPFDWYETWPRLLRVTSQYFNNTQTALNVGCGNSNMSAEMGATFKTVVNIDISAVVIKQMEEMYRQNANVLWFQMDCTRMTFDDNMFDMAFDKGTLDALMCGNKADETVEGTLREIYRVLLPGGCFFEITYGKPKGRLALFLGFEIGWIEKTPIPIRNPDKGGWHWIYILQKPEMDSLE
jgi:ubiquinone/menaquinone biosynthesis C-methylase UbiE